MTTNDQKTSPGGKSESTGASKRTDQQNRALHKWFSEIEMHCWERGLTLDALFKEPAEIPITKEYLKGFFRRVESLMYGKESTTQLTKQEMSKVVDVCQREFAKRLDYTDPFPSIESLENKSLDTNLENC